MSQRTPERRSDARLSRLAAQLAPRRPAARPAAAADDTIQVLVIGGLGTVGSGLRTYLPTLDSRYSFTSIDLPGSDDKAPENGVGLELECDKYYGDVLHEPELLRTLVQGKHMVVYLARRKDLAEMNAMTDLVFETCLAQPQPPFVIGASSVHAIDGPGPGSYTVHSGVLSTLSDRRFEDIDVWPERIKSTTPSVGEKQYTVEKRHCEEWCQKCECSRRF